MTTKSYSFWLTDAEMAKAKDSHVPDILIAQIAKHLFLSSIDGQNPEQTIIAMLQALLQNYQILDAVVAVLEKIPGCDTPPIPADLMFRPENLPAEAPKQPLPEQIKTLLAENPNGLIIPDIASALSISKPTANRQIRLLEENGIVGRKSSGIGKYRAYYLRGVE